MPATQRKRKLHIDILRLLAAFLVIYNHTPGYHYFLNYTNEHYKLILTIVLSCITTINVPVFFMISGALLLGREESYGFLFSKRIGRFAAVLFFASAVYYGLASYGERQLEWFFRGLLSCSISLPYWFLYTYLGFLFALPFLRKIAKHLCGQDVLLLIGLRFVCVTLVSVIRYVAEYLGYDFAELSAYFTIPFAFTDMLFYPLVGYYLEEMVPVEKIGKKAFGILLCIACGCIMIATGFTYHQGVYRGGFTQNWLGMLSYLVAPAVYLIVKAACSRIPEKCMDNKLNGAIHTAGSLTLGVYIMDPVLLRFVSPWIRETLGASLLLVPVSVLYCCLSMILCGTITWFLKKLPVFKKIL